MQILTSLLVFQVDKSSIVMDTIHYIKSLEGTLMELEKRKQEMQLERGKVGAAANSGISSSAMAITPTALVAQAPVVLPGAGIWSTGAAPPITVGMVAPAPVGLQTWSGQNVVLSLSGNDAWINVCVARRLGVLTMVMAVLEKHNIDVVTLGISSDNARTMFTIHARVSKTLVLHLATYFLGLWLLKYRLRI
jgi:hypothetical protein